MTYPFDDHTLHRFQGVIVGTIAQDGDHLTLRTADRVFRLLPAFGNGRIIRALWEQYGRDPDGIVRFYGFPKTSPDGIVQTLTLVSFHPVGAERQNDSCIASKIEDGQVFLCARVLRQGDDGLTLFKVKRERPGPGPNYWLVTGQCMEKVKVQSKVLMVGWIAPDGRLMLKLDRVIRKAPKKTDRRIRRKPQSVGVG